MNKWSRIKINPKWMMHLEKGVSITDKELIIVISLVTLLVIIIYFFK